MSFSSRDGKVVVVNTAPWLLIMQFVLLILHYGHIVTLPWWLVFGPFLMWLMVCLIMIAVVVAFVAFAAVERTNMILAIAIGGGALLIAAYLLHYVWVVVTSFLMSIV